jgi:SAM-dependent methyltransferase
MITQHAPTYSTDLVYANRTQKAAYIASKYGSILRGRVLDVGCDRKQLKDALVAAGNNISYVGVDISQWADVRVDLETGTLPFADRSFECVVASDVLEHVDAAHAMIDEVCRVSARWVIISLPNPYRNFLMELVASGGRLTRMKYYGLPAQREPDRHKWFFGNRDAQHYIRSAAERCSMRLVQADSEDRGLPPEVLAAMPGITPCAQIADGTLWCVLERS